MTPDILHHATALVVGRSGLLLLGESGSGKSTLAAALITRGGQLIADDQVQLSSHGGQLLAQAPHTLEGVLELRGFGLIRVPHLASHKLHLVVRCQTQPPERLPEPETTTLLGVTLPIITLNPVATHSAECLILWVEAMQEGRVLPQDWLPSRN
jgi:HPr kinase/phosphorylase